MKVKDLVAGTLAVVLGLGSLPAHAQERGVVVDRTAIEQAVSNKVRSDEGERAAIRTLLQRDEVKQVAGELGVDLRRADSRVASLEGKRLHETAAQATAANDALVGGTTTIQISVVTLLLVIIIIILLAD